MAKAVYPEVERIRLVHDNLSTHSAVTFYEVSSPVGGEDRVRQHACARLVVEYGRDRTVGGAGKVISETPSAGHRDATRGSGSVGEGEQPDESDSRLALHNSQRTKLRKLYPSIEPRLRISLLAI